MMSEIWPGMTAMEVLAGVGRSLDPEETPEETLARYGSITAGKVDGALKCLQEELGTWPTPSTLRADLPDVPGWQWAVKEWSDVELVSALADDLVITKEVWDAMCEPSLWPGERDAPADPGAHYRREIRRRITDDDIARGWVSVKLDPYRICRVVGIAGGPHEHATKKLLRGEAKGHEARTVIREARACLDRWEEMLDEDEEEARCR